MDQSNPPGGDDRPPSHTSLTPQPHPSSAPSPIPQPALVPHHLLNSSSLAPPPQLHHGNSFPTGQHPASGPPGTRPPLPQSYSTSAAIPHRGPSPFAPPPPLNNGGFPGQGQGQGQGQQDTRTQLFISNLPFRVRWQDLKDLMRKCGTVLRADVALSPTDGRSRGFGVVLFARASDAALAIQTYHGYTWQTRVLDVRIDAQDPTGALALAEANRQQAIQQQQRVLERARASPVPPPPPPPHGAGVLMGGPYPAGTMLVPVPSPLGQASFLAPPPPPPPIPPQQQQQHPSQPPQQLPTPLPSPGSPEASLRPSSSHAGSPFLQPAAAASPNGNGGEASCSPALAASPSPAPAPGTPQPPPPPPLPLKIPPPSAGPGDVPPQLALSQQQAAQAQAVGQGQGQGPMMVPLQMGMQMQMVNVPMQMGMGVGGAMGMVGVHPMGYAVPAVPMGVPGGLMSYYAAQQPNRPASSPIPAHYTNRHLFVGNLPFNCQWQELKDLMRGAGSVLRADIAQGPDGRSRGFGSVLFATPQDAERAVNMFNGYEFNGRGLKVHFDKFSGAGINGGNPNNGPHGHHPSHPPLQHAHSHGSSPYGPPPPHPQQQHQQFVMPVPVPAYQRTVSGFEQQQQQQVRSSPQPPAPDQLFSPPQQQQSIAGSPYLADQRQLAEPHAVEDGARDAASASPSAEQRPPTASAGSEAASTAAAHVASPSGGVTAPLPPAHAHPPPPPGHHKSHPLAPSRIAMPPPIPFSSSGGQGPFSPLHTRNLPPMTPSMPAFTFAPFAAPTPPLHPHALFSPGIGPFSPGLGGPAGGGGAFFAAAAGGAPQQQHPQAQMAAQPPTPGGVATPGWAQTPGHGLYGGANPMFAGFSPVQQGYMNGHGHGHGYAQTPGPQEQYGFSNGATIPEGSEPGSGGGGVSSAGDAPSHAQAMDEPSYFPPVPAVAAASPPVSTAGASPTLSKPQPSFPTLAAQQTGASHSAPPMSPEPSHAGVPASALANGRPSLAGAGHSKSDTAAAAATLANGLNGLSLAPSPSPHAQPARNPTPVGAAFSLHAAAPGWAEGLSPPAAGESSGVVERRRSFIPGLAVGESLSAEAASPVDVARRKFESASGGATPALSAQAVAAGAAAAGEAVQPPPGRRASFDSGAAPRRAAFGTSIWG